MKIDVDSSYTQLLRHMDACVRSEDVCINTSYFVRMTLSLLRHAVVNSVSDILRPVLTAAK